MDPSIDAPAARARPPSGLSELPVGRNSSMASNVSTKRKFSGGSEDSEDTEVSLDFRISQTLWFHDRYASFRRSFLTLLLY